MLLLFLTIALSCIRDSMDGCPYYLRFSYIFNMDGTERFPSEVKAVSVMVLDDAGHKVYEKTETDSIKLSDPSYRMELPPELRGMRAIVWAGIMDRDYELTSDFGVRLSTDAGLYIAPLWHGGPVTLGEEPYVRTDTVSLIRTTNTIRVFLDGNQGDTPPAMWIEADNTVCGPDHTVIHSGGHAWQPYHAATDSTCFSVMRLTEDMTVILHVAGLPDIELIKYFLSSCPAGMSGEEYLDREHVWTVRIGWNDSLVTYLTVNGWTIWFHDQSL